jgi:hypothetical protein
VEAEVGRGDYDFVGCKHRIQGKSKSGNLRFDAVLYPVPDWQKCRAYKALGILSMRRIGVKSAELTDSAIYRLNVLGE